MEPAMTTTLKIAATLVALSAGTAAHASGWDCPDATAWGDLTLDLYRMEGYRLRVSVISDCDSTLLIQTGVDNWFFDDDDNGNLDAEIILTRPSNGLFDIWVGTYDGSYCDATLYFETY